jgi:hypothetical protein
MNFKMLRLVVCCIALVGSAFLAGAQTRERVHEVSAFSAIDVKDNFEVTVAKGGYGVKLTVDNALSDYVKAYVKGYTLYIFCDEKAIPKEVKKMYKGRNAPVPVLRALVYVPELASVTLDGESTLSGADTFSAERFEMTLAGKSNVKNLTVTANSAKVQLKKNAQAVLTLETNGEIDATTEGSSSLRLSCKSRDLSLTASGSSQLNVSGDVLTSLSVNTEGSSQTSVGVNTAKVYVSSTGSSKVGISGTANTLTVKTARSANVDAMGLPVLDVEAEMNDGTATVSAEKSLQLDLAGGSALYYNGTPEFKIVKIMKSTVAPVGTK